MAKLSKKAQQERQAKQKRIIMGIIAVVVCVIAAGVFIVNRGPSLADPDTFSDGIPVYGPLTLNDAQIACERYARNSLGRSIKTLSMDNRSSRLDKRKGWYVVYMEAYIFRDGAVSGASDHHYINCASSKSSLSLTKFEIIKNEDEKIKAQRKEKGSRYGWQ